MPLEIVRSVRAMRVRVQEWHSQSLRVAVVPTMGALHDGHVSLIDMAREQADKVIATIFVNPTQFGVNEDFSAYPRQEKGDAARLDHAGCDLLYAPDLDEMYPQGFATTVSVAGVSQGACGDSRPGHFEGVATVVSKLLLQTQADLGVFGEKDWQQLQVIRRVVRDLDIPCAILGAPISRDHDGLARSSRNVYLTEKEREIAPTLYQTLCSIEERLSRGDGSCETLIAWGKAQLVAAGFASVDYLDLRDTATFAPVESVERPARLLVAARLGKARLLDNIAIQPGGVRPR